jgi:hypothetical protein
MNRPLIRNTCYAGRYLIKLVRDQAELILDSTAAVVERFRDNYGDYRAIQRVEGVISSQCRRILANLV